MTPSHDLHLLIHALDKGEKAWFALHAEKGADYQRLFDAIRDQKVYNEEAIKIQFKGESFLKRLPAVKNYLFHFILECLNNQHSDDNSSAKQTRQLRFVELLIQKNMKQPALKLVRKIKQRCVEQELFLVALQAIALEKLILKSKVMADVDELLLALQQEEIMLMRRYENLTEYVNMEIHLTRVRQVILNSRTQSDLKQFKDLLKHPLLRKESLALSFDAKILFNRIKGICTQQTYQYKEATKYFERIVDLYESLPDFTIDLIMYYSGALFELGVSARNEGNANRALELAKKINALEKQYPNFLTEKRKSVLFKRSAILETDVLQFFGRFEEGAQRLTAIEKLQQRYMEYIDLDLLLILNYNAALLYYGVNRLRKALQCLGLIIREHRGEIVHDLICFAHLFRLIIHIDLGNDDLIASIAKHTVTYLEKRQRLFQTETLFLEFSIQLAKGKYDSQLELLKRMKTQFDKIQKQPSEKIVVEYFDFSAWFTSKIERRSYAEVYRELRK
jgi:hypothetical protein